MLTIGAMTAQVNSHPVVQPTIMVVICKEGKVKAAYEKSRYQQNSDHQGKKKPLTKEGHNTIDPTGKLKANQ